MQLTMKMARCAVACLFAVSVLTACAPDDAEPPAAIPSPEAQLPDDVAAPDILPDGAPQTFTVDVDGMADDFNTSFLAYFPPAVTVHPGDTVDFNMVHTGEPHTVTFGRLVDAAAAKWDEMGFEAAGTDEFAVLPLMIPEDEPVAVQSAAQPCHLVDGEPGTEACSDQDLPDFDGTSSFYNSGWLEPEQTYSVTFADDIAPGTYRFLCLLHMPFMVGSVTVAPSDEEIDSPDEVAAAGAAVRDSLAAPLVAAMQAVEAPPGGVMAGLLVEEVPVGLGLEFLPAELSIDAGDTVVWTALGPHTVSFNAPQGANQLRVETVGGAVNINPQAMAPSNSPGMPMAPEPDMDADAEPPDPDAPPPPPIAIDAGEWDGQGFLSSGALFSFPPGPLVTYSVTFMEPGTYAYECLIHPRMEGRIVVR